MDGDRWPRYDPVVWLCGCGNRGGIVRWLTVQIMADLANIVVVILDLFNIDRICNSMINFHKMIAHMKITHIGKLFLLKYPYIYD